MNQLTHNWFFIVKHCQTTQLT